VNAFFGEGSRMLLVFSEAGVSAVYDQVSGFKLVPEVPDYRICNLAGRNHDPDNPGCRYGRDELINGRYIRDLWVSIQTCDFNAALTKPFAHVETHFAKAD
jgi:hypothetical protein